MGQGTEVTIETRHGSEAEKRTRQLLLDVMAGHDLDRFTFTNRVVVDETAIPHSHPVLTMSTRFMVRSVDGALSDYLHEQLHWFVSSHRRASRAVNREWRRHFGTVPRAAGGGAKTRRSTLLHLTVNWLEQNALADVVGSDRATVVLNAKVEGHVYPWCYQQVRDHGEVIGETLRMHSLTVAQ